MGGVTMNLFICYSKCSTCKKAKVFLDKENFLYQERDIKEQNPTFEELKKWHEKGIPLKKMFNTSGNLYKEMKLKEKIPNMTEEEQLKLLSTNGMLVKRPILITSNQVLFGFKEEEYKKVL